MSNYTIYYDSKTGNVKRFVNKLKDIIGESLILIQVGEETDDLEIGHLISHTTKIGLVPERTKLFLEKNSDIIKTITVSGNMNWGLNYGKCLDVVIEQYPSIEGGFKFELSGTTSDVDKYIKDILKIKK